MSQNVNESNADQAALTELLWLIHGKPPIRQENVMPRSKTVLFDLPGTGPQRKVLHQPASCAFFALWMEGTLDPDTTVMFRSDCTDRYCGPATMRWGDLKDGFMYFPSPLLLPCNASLHIDAAPGSITLHGLDVYRRDTPFSKAGEKPLTQEEVTEHAERLIKALGTLDRILKR